MRKTLTLTLAVALFAILAAVVVAQVGDDPAPGGTSTTTETTESAPDVTTPEATTPERTTTTEDNPERVGTETSPSDDISGPCDEAEHASDPRCSGAVTGDERGGEEHEEDNSGPGSVNSGHSGGDDSDDDSGGHGGDDDD
jgi:hypothetical protein